VQVCFLATVSIFDISRFWNIPIYSKLKVSQKSSKTTSNIKMNVYLCTSTASHNDEQHPTTSPIVSEACGESENTDAEGRQTNVDIPFTTSRTDPSFFYPKGKSCSSLKWGTGNASESKPLPCLGDERIAASKNCVLVKISAESVTSEGSQKENTNVPLAVQLREIRGPIQDADSDESSLSKNISGVILRHRRTIAQQVRVDIAVGAMSVPTALKIATENMETNENFVSDVSFKKRIARTCVNTLKYLR
jgi:hypothetical protein